MKLEKKIIQDQIKYTLEHRYGEITDPTLLYEKGLLEKMYHFVDNQYDTLSPEHVQRLYDVFLKLRTNIDHHDLQRKPVIEYEEEVTSDDPHDDS